MRKRNQITRKRQHNRHGPLLFQNKELVVFANYNQNGKINEGELGMGRRETHMRNWWQS
jgi:hypothetical protein